MKTAYAAVLGIVALLLGACITGDEITNYVIDPDGSIEFTTYRDDLTLIQAEAGEDAKTGYSPKLPSGVWRRRVTIYLQSSWRPVPRRLMWWILCRTSPAGAVLVRGHLW